ncbi:MAG: T9SS type A sorting domain-containing protein [Bacteroidia bacterium]
MTQRLLALLVAILLITNYLQAQHAHEGRTCATMEYNQKKMENDPKFAEFQKNWTKKMEAISKNPSKTRGVVYVIPTVVHILYKNANEQLSMADVQSQIDILNKDFRKLNADASLIPAGFQPIAADFEIEFCLATKDPQGNPTTGVTITATTNPGFSSGADDIKYTAQGGMDAWPTDTYLNIWVGDIGGGLLGYAQFPGGPAAEDGVVSNFNCFGSANTTGQLIPQYNLGRTVTHEIGHWLGLRHVWGDQGGCTPDDNIADTPPQDQQNFGCPALPLFDACTGSGAGVMCMNYMDYTDDACMYMFSEGQKAVSRALLDPGGARASLLTNNTNLCTIIPPPPVVVLDAGLNGLTPSGNSCISILSPSFSMDNALNSDSILNTVVLSYTINGGAAQTYTWTGTLAQGASTNITLPALTLPAGANTISVQVTSVNGITDANATNNVTTTNINVINVAPGVVPPIAEGFENSTFGTLSVVNPGANTTWQIFSGVASLGTKGLKIANWGNSAYNDVDELVLPDIDLTNGYIPSLSFDYAYAMATLGYSDTLEILISADCGTSYQTLAKYYNNSLATVSNTTSQFVPTIKNHWKNYTHSLVPYLGNPALKIKFRNTSTAQNNLYLDNINITMNFTGVELPNQLQNQVSFFPNPANEQVQIRYEGNADSYLKVQLLDISGRAVLMENYPVKTGSNDLFMNVSNLSSGVYMLRFDNGVERYTQKLVLNK